MTASMNVETIASAVCDVDRTVQSDDAAEGGERIGFARAHVGVGGAEPGRRAARVGVLDDDGGGLGELERRCARPNRGRAGWCTTAPCPAAPARAPSPSAARRIPRGRLMRVLAVAEVAHLRQARARGGGAPIDAVRSPARTVPSRSIVIVSSVAAIARVVRRRVRERLAREVEPERERRTAGASSASSTADSRRATTTTSTSRKFLAAARTMLGPPMSISSIELLERRRRDWRRLLERIEVDGDDVDQADAVRGGGREVRRRGRAARGCRRAPAGAASSRGRPSSRESR